MAKADSRVATDSEARAINSDRMAISKERPGPTDSGLAMVPSKAPTGNNLARMERGGTQVGGGFGQQAGDRTDQRGGQSGDVRYGGGGGADGTVWGNINTGNNRYGGAGPRPAPPDASGNPADTERTYQQGMRELNQLRQMVQSDPQATKEVQELARQMQQLDPSRFPGNPAMVEADAS